MKWIIYTLGLTLLISSCKSVQKLVDKGDYDGAIYLAAKKLHGKKNKKTKHIKGLEEAFAKVNARDFAFINSLNAQKYPERWDKVYDLLINIDSRQHKISPFLPLISKDGYVGHFEFTNIAELIDDASAEAAAYHYGRAELLLTDINYSRKADAIEAFNELRQIDRYFRDYKQKLVLMNTAHHYGMTRVKLETRNTARAIIPNDLQQELMAVSIPALNSFWTEFYTNDLEKAPMDYRAVLEIDELEVSPERETERIYQDSREVIDGFTYVLDQNGNVAKDTLGNDITEDRFVIITADIVEIYREKAAYVKGTLKIIDLNGKQLIDQFPIASEAIFNSYASSYFGDERALSSSSRNRVRSNPERFPQDEELIWQAAEDVKSVVADYLQDIRYF